MTPRERAKKLLVEKGLSHIVYGIVVDGHTTETDWDNEMLKFDNDKEFFEYTDQMYADGIEMILAVHA